MKRLFLIIVLGLQSAFLLGITFVQERNLARGTAILLETRPVDPRDLLRGDYLTLDYKIGHIPTNLFTPPVNLHVPEGTEIFVAVAPGPDHFNAVTHASTNSFAPSGNEVLLKGKVTYSWETDTVRVDYGIDRYYIAEGTGNVRGHLTVQAAVSASGRAMIRQVFVDNVPFADKAKAR